ncbi:MAG TPA: iron ABC transporter permease [Tepidisphaeraceae bacterium]|jgi:iron(III) transport system permease protein
MQTKSSHILTAILLYAFFGVFLIWPIAQGISAAFVRHDQFTLEYFQLIFHDPVLMRGLLNSALVAIAVTVLCLLLSLPLAMVMRYEFPGRNIFQGLLLLPLILPPFVGAIGIRQLLSRFGPITVILNALSHHHWPMGIDWLGRMRFLGVIVIETLGLYPILLLNLQAALANIDPSLELAAANLGAGKMRIFRRIILPLLRPGLFAGCTLVLIWSFTELGTPLMFDVYTLTPVQIFSRITDVSDNPIPFALVFVLLIASALLYAIGKIVLGRGLPASTTKAGRASTQHPLHGLSSFAAILFCASICFLAILPHLSVILISLSSPGSWYQTLLPAHFTLVHYFNALRDPLVIPSIANSILYASLATVLAAIVALGVAMLVTRSHLPTRYLLDSLSMLPLAVPGIVLAFGYVAISIHFKQRFGDRTPSWLDFQQSPLLLLIIAYATRRLPYIVRSIVAGLEQIPYDLELAAANLGANAGRVLRKITLPLITANLLAGVLLAFTFAMLEVSDSLILAQRTDYYPITKAIWELSARLGDGPCIAAALGVWAMLVLGLTLLCANSVLGKKMGALFRI